MGKRVRKDTLNIACSFRTVSLPRLTDHPSCGRFIKNQQKKLLVGAWNVRTLLDRDNTARPERRTALIAKELACYRIDIAALSETRLADEGILKEDGGGYTFFWRDKSEAEDKLHGVGLTIRTRLMKFLPSLPDGINGRLMKLRLPLSLVPTPPPLPALTKQRKKLNEALDQLIRSTSPNDKLLTMGDFNAIVGKNQASWKKDTWISRCWENGFQWSTPPEQVC